MCSLKQKSGRVPWNFTQKQSKFTRLVCLTSNITLKIKLFWKNMNFMSQLGLLAIKLMHILIRLSVWRISVKKTCPCLISASLSRTIYEKLSSAFTEEQQALYQQRVDEIAPNLRYCAYNIGDESALQDLQKMRIGAGDQLTSKLDVGVVFLDIKKLLFLWLNLLKLHG